MPTQFKFEWYNTSKHKLTNYQRLVFCWLVGHLANESILPEDVLITIEHSVDCLYIRCYGVNVSLIEEYLRHLDKCGIKSDTQTIGKAKVYAGLLMRHREMTVGPNTIQEITIA